MLNAEASNLPTVKSLIRTHGNPNKVPSGMVSHIIQLHIAASAKHLQAIMMLCLNWGASFPTESSSGNAEGKQQQEIFGAYSGNTGGRINVTTQPAKY